MARRYTWAGIFSLTLAFAVQAAGSSAPVRVTMSVRCSAHGLSFELRGGKSRYAVVGLNAQGVGCAAARSVAARVAQDLLHGHGVSIPSAVGLAMTQESCTGCGAPTTSVLISYPRGKVTVSLRGSSSATAPAPVPGVPTPGSPGTVI